MDGYKSIGQLSKPPLVYTVGYIAINLTSIKDHIGKLHDRLRDDYPGFMAMEVEVTRNRPITGEQENDVIEQFIFNNPDQSWGALFTHERIIFHTNKYTHFHDFGERFKKVLDVFKEVTALKFHAGIAFRQVDNILPLGEEKGLSCCINPRFLAPPIFGDLKNNFARQEYRYTAKENTKVIQRLYSFEAKDGRKIPADLLASYIAFDMEIVNDKVPPPFMLADFESSRLLGGKSEPFDTDKLIAELDEFHKYASLAFREVITPEALKRRS